MTCDIPIILLAKKQDYLFLTNCIQLGLNDYQLYPLSTIELNNKIDSLVCPFKELRTIKEQEDKLKRTLQDYDLEFENIKAVVVDMFVSILEFKENSTKAHVYKIKSFMAVLTEALVKNRQFESLLTPSYIKNIQEASVLHDIGKLGIPDYIINKPSKLTLEEYEIIKKHPVIGYNTLKKANSRLKTTSFLSTTEEIVLYHHEKWDGSGYPYHLKANEIPLSARILAVVDVYDALTSNRVYKKAYPHNLAVEIIKSEKNQHFQPEIVDAFLEVESYFQTISNQYKY